MGGRVEDVFSYPEEPLPVTQVPPRKPPGRCAQRPHSQCSSTSGQATKTLEVARVVLAHTSSWTV